MVTSFLVKIQETHSLFVFVEVYKIMNGGENLFFAFSLRTRTLNNLKKMVKQLVQERLLPPPPVLLHTVHNSLMECNASGHAAD